MAKRTKVTEFTHQGPRFPEIKEKTIDLGGEHFEGLPARMLDAFCKLYPTDHFKDKVFIRNFMISFNAATNNKYAEKWKDFPKCFESEIEKYYTKCDAAHKAELEKKREETQLFFSTMTREEKKAYREKIAAEKKEKLLKETECTFNGKIQHLAAPVIEVGGLFMGRGDLPLKGAWKIDIVPEDVTINWLSKDKDVPEPPAGHHWKEVTHKSTLNAWTYQFHLLGFDSDRIYLNKKCALDPKSDAKTNLTTSRFDTARTLSQKWDELHKMQYDDLSKTEKTDLQRALAIWLVMETGIRVGTEHSEEFDNGTKGICLLEVGDMIIGPDFLDLDFYGKDSVHYANKLENIDAKVIDGFKKITDGKAKNELIFDKINEGFLNDYLKNYIKELTFKSFRTSLGSKILVEYFRENPVKPNMTEAQKLQLFKNANLLVAKKLNHQSGVAKNNDSLKKKLERFDEQIKAVEDRIKLEEQKQKSCVDPKKKAKAKENKEKQKAKLKELKEKKDYAKRSKNFALGTSKGSYCDPRVIISWCKSVGLPIQKIYSKNQINQFEWAGDVDEKFWKKYC